MAVLTLTDTEVWLREAVGTSTLLEGRRLLEQASVARDAQGGAARVVGSVTCDGQVHRVDARVLMDSESEITGFDGWCTCGRAVPCPHTIALLLSEPVASGSVASGSVALEPIAVRTTDAPPAVVVRRPGPWAAALTKVLELPGTTGGPDGGGRRTFSRPTREVGLQFEVTQVPGSMILLRPVLIGASGGWVRSGITWDTLDYGEYYTRDLPPQHVRLLRELAGLPSRVARGYHERAICLDAVASRRVWDLLVEAQEQALPMVLSGRRADLVLVHAEPAVPVLDVARSTDGDGLVLQPRLEIDGRLVDDYFAVGLPPHGVGWSGSGASAGLQLARLAVAPPPLFSALVKAGGLTIPRADEEYFSGDYVPALRQQLKVVSRDGSFDVPAPKPPVLRLTVTGRGFHVIELTWDWVYAVGSGMRHEPLLDGGTSHGGQAALGRDHAAESRALDAVTPWLADHPDLVSNVAGRLRPRPSAALGGLATARFMTDVLPLLQACEDVEVDLEFPPDAPAYEEVDAPPVVEFTAGATASGAVAGSLEQDWFDLAVTVTMEGREVPFERLFIALAQDQSHLVLDDGRYFSLDRPEFLQLAQLIAESRALFDSPPGTVRLNRFHAGLWDDVERLGEIRGQVDGWRAAVSALASAAHVEPPAVPAALQATLRPYQEAGFGWLARLFELGLGGVLADDMGLGKTLQSLALMVHARANGTTDKPFLVVAPTSVVGNWVTEAARFAPSLRVAAITQTAARRGCDVRAATAGADLVVTSYTLFRLEFDEYRELPWAVLFLDEAQNVKNHRSAGYLCARRLPADIKVAITGTPMENNLMELWAMLSITAPGLFPHPDRFTEYYRTPIEREHDADRLAQFRRRIKPLLLRRHKQEVAADLPDRQEQVLELELSPKHRAVYAKYLQRERQKVLGLLGDLQRNRFEIFRSLTLLRQASLDVSLIDPSLGGVPSTKLDALSEHLEHIVSEGHRVLVFSQFTRFLGHARDRLEAAGIEYCYLDGSTRNRAMVISQFRAGSAPVFLISLKAGGSGLNLTEADYVILLDPWWNPATEAQAVDRAHRIGQTRKVMVYRMVAKDTIEEKVMALKARKAALTAGVLDDGQFTSGALTAEDIRALLG